MLKQLVSVNDGYAENILKSSIVWMKDIGAAYRDKMAKIRYNYIKNSRVLTMVGLISDDLFNCNRLLPPNTKLEMEIIRSTPQFALIRKEDIEDNFIIKWLKAELTMTRVCLNEQYESKILHGISNGDSYFPYLKTVTQRIDSLPGPMSLVGHSIFHQKFLPDRVLVAIVPQGAVGAGGYSTNPMIFPARKHSVSYLGFSVNGRLIGKKPYTPEWEKEDAAADHMSLVRATGAADNLALAGGSIGYEEFINDYGVFVANIRGENGVEAGRLDIEMRFSKALKDYVAVLVVGEFRSCMIRHKDGSIHDVDY